MILKVKAVNPEAIESWRYFDGVEGFHWSRYSADEAMKICVNPAVTGVQFLDLTYPAGTPHDVERGYAFFAFVSETTGPMEILCETSAYLLNDSGKTIEKLI